MSQSQLDPALSRKHLLAKQGEATLAHCERAARNTAHFPESRKPVMPQSERRIEELKE